MWFELMVYQNYKNSLQIKNNNLLETLNINSIIFIVEVHLRSWS